MLLDGTLAAYLSSGKDPPKELAREVWQSESRVSLVETKKVGSGVIRYRISGEVLISRVQLRDLLKLAKQIQKQSHQRARDRGGAPARYDSEAFLIEAFRELYEGRSSPKRPAELRERALDAYAKNGHPGGVPSEDWARGKIKKLWTSLGLGNSPGIYRPLSGGWGSEPR